MGAVGAKARKKNAADKREAKPVERPPSPVREEESSPLPTQSSPSASSFSSSSSSDPPADPTPELQLPPVAENPENKPSITQSVPVISRPLVVSFLVVSSLSCSVEILFILIEFCMSSENVRSPSTFSPTLSCPFLLFRSLASTPREAIQAQRRQRLGAPR